MRRISHTYLIHVFTVIRRLRIFRNILLFDIDKLVYDRFRVAIIILLLRQGIQ